MYTLEELMGSFETIMENKHKNVSGIKIFDSGIPGPTFGVTIHTHGNEPSGLAIYQHLIDTDIVSRLTHGRVMVVMNNPEATKRFFAATNVDEAVKARYKDVNMNRLPEDAMEQIEPSQYEVRRAQELIDVWREFDAAVDVHSTRQNSRPMMIILDPVPDEILLDIPINIMITNIINVQRGLSPAALYGKPGSSIPVFGIESGQHEDDSSFLCATQTIEALLSNLKMTDGSAVKPYRGHPIEVYEVDGAIWVPDESYRLDRHFTMFEFVEAGTLIAEGDGEPVHMPWDGHTLMGPRGTKIADHTEEVLFLTKPMWTIER